MSKQLSRIRNLISEIEEIQKRGKEWAKPMSPNAFAQEFPVEPSVPSEKPIPAPDSSFDSNLGPSGNNKISMQLTMGIVIQLQLEGSGETIQVRALRDTIEVRFTDGKTIHLPLKFAA